MAEAKEKDDIILLTPVMRMTYVKVHNPGESKKENLKTKKKDLIYEGTGLVPFTDGSNKMAMIQSAGLGEVYALARATLLKRWPNTAKSNDGFWFIGMRSPFRFPNDDSYIPADHPEYANVIRIPMRSYNIQPKVCRNDENRTLITEASEFYSGCWAIASVRCYTYDNEIQGVSISAKAFIKMRDDEPFVGVSVEPMNEFKSIAPAELGDNPQMFAKQEAALPDGV